MLVAVAAGCGSGETPLPLMRVESPAPQAPLLAPITELVAAGKLSDALELANRLVAQHPESAAAYEARASVHHKLRQWGPAVADFDRAVTLDPASARLRNNRGFLLLTLERFDEATADFDEALRLSPDFSHAYNNRALVSIALGRYRQAIDDLDRALARKPDYIDAANNRGFSLMQLGRWDRALADFNRVLKRDPKYVNALANRGLVKLQMGDLSGSVLDFTEAMLLDPDNPKYYAHRRDAYAAQGDLARARQDEQKIQHLMQLQELATSLTENPQRVDVYLARAKLHRQRGNDRGELDDLNRAVELAPGKSQPRLQRARYFLESKQYAAAIADCEAVLAVGPNELAYSIRGDCRLAQKELDGALADFEQARRLDDAVAEAYYLKGNEYARQGDAERAKAYHERAEAVDPEVAARLK
jgi:tetratricopeptide (TPR) repeat protein